MSQHIRAGQGEGGFHPPRLLRNPHLQSILNSIPLRRPLVARRARGMLQAAVPHVLDCGGGVRLMGCYSGQPSHDDHPADLCILIHGWEGSAASSYLVSAAGFLWDRGMNVFRLNLRDHGPSHHLNAELFHSCRIDEVVGAVWRVQDLFPHRRLYLAGFSLGGNFALRVTLRAPGAGIHLAKTMTVCPVLHPPSTLLAMETGLPVYERYFMKKWRRSLGIKRRYFPQNPHLSRIGKFATIREMTDYFVRHCTEYPDLETYLNGYSITGSRLAGLRTPTLVLCSRDDPVIPARDLANLAGPACLLVETSRYGGHCGFLMDTRLTSWAERRMADWFLETPAEYASQLAGGPQ